MMQSKISTLRNWCAVLAMVIGVNVMANAQNPECTLVEYNLTLGMFQNEVSFSLVNPNGTAVFSYTYGSATSGVLCLPNGCYTAQLNDSFGDGWNGAYLSLSIMGGGSFGGTFTTGSSSAFSFGVNAEGCGVQIAVGCTDDAAANYDPAANVDDGSCIYEGCTDPAAVNYSANATEDDGSCEYCNGEGSSIATLYVCTFSNGQNVEFDIVDSNGNVVISVGGLSSGAIEYFDICLMEGECYTVNMSNAAGLNGWSNGYFWINVNGWQVINQSLDANLNAESAIFSIDGTCTQVAGCTDPEAINYNASANVDNGSCFYALNCEDNTSIGITMTTGSFANEVSWQIQDANGIVVVQSPAYTTNNTLYTQQACFPDGCYTLIMLDSFGDGWNGGVITITGGGAQLFSGTITYSQEIGAAAISINAEGCETTVASGCTNATADNYDPAALIDDGSCEFSGCTDPSAMNYDSYANVDDGSCIYCEDGATAQMYVCTFSNGQYVNINIVDSQGNEVISVSNLNNGAIVYFDLCLLAGECYTVNMTNAAGLNGWNNGYFWINVNGWQVINESLDANASSETAIFSIDGTCGDVLVPGCTDPNATNYNPDATVNDGSCQYPVIIYGCTDPLALNYNPEATVDNGMCFTAADCDMNVVEIIVTGGTFPSEISYSIIGSDGNFLTSGYAGTQYACAGDGCYTVYMYDSFGDGWNGGEMTVTVNGTVVATMTLTGMTSYGLGSFGVNSEDCAPDVTGCTDPNAINFDPNATSDDGSCQYEADCDGNFLTIYLTTQNWGSEISWSLVGEDGVSVVNGTGYSSWDTYIVYACVPDGCYTLEMNDSWGDGWNGGWIMIYGANAYLDGTLFGGTSGTLSVGVNSACSEIAGCTDPSAINYNWNATTDDGSCIYYNDGAGLVGFEGMDVELNLFPNPTNGGMVLDCSNLSALEGIEITITGLDGKVVGNLEIPNEAPARRIDLDVTNYAAGYYLLQFRNGDNNKVVPFVKQ